METPSVFNQFFMWLGPYKWPLIVIAAIVVFLIIRKAVDLFFRKGLDETQLKRGLNAILFWGSFGLAVGMFAQVAGIWAALKEIMAAADISPAIVLIGFYGSFMTTLFGLGILLVAALAWWLFRYRIQQY